MPERHFTKATFRFLSQLEANNNRVWFDEHRQDYEDAVRTPALDFIDAMADDIHALSPHFIASAKKVGGSLMRVHRDVRFGRDKRPFKTNIGIQFRHVQGKDVHAPGFYVHLEPEECFLGVGIWHPDGTALGKIRMAIDENATAWKKASRDPVFATDFTLSGDALVNAPRGYAKDHPLLDDLKRKDFIAIMPFNSSLACSEELQPVVVKAFRSSIPFMKFLCHALELPF
ncbi:MAG: DUF2461 domain-containing protein [Gammaproteobacteria bacterium]|nr:DUF2461 domain-containing protein [Gammaproteobacteria bacterium]